MFCCGFCGVDIVPSNLVFDYCMHILLVENQNENSVFCGFFSCVLGAEFTLKELKEGVFIPLLFRLITYGCLLAWLAYDMYKCSA